MYCCLSTWRWRGKRLSANPSQNSPQYQHFCRYLKVPISTACGSSSADSIISSSSGHFMSETGGTPGTISSASSMDELNMETNSRQASRKCLVLIPALDTIQASLPPFLPQVDTRPRAKRIHAAPTRWNCVNRPPMSVWMQSNLLHRCPANPHRTNH